MREVTYHTREWARGLMTSARPRKDRIRWRQEERVFSTAAIRGFQLTSSRLPGPRKTPRTLILTDNQLRVTGGSEQLAQGPSQRPLNRLSLEPEPRSYTSETSKQARMASSEHTTSDVSSAYCEIGDLMTRGDKNLRCEDWQECCKLIPEPQGHAEGETEDSPAGHHKKEKRTRTSNH